MKYNSKSFLIILFAYSLLLSACQKDGIKPKLLEKKWWFVTGTYEDAPNNGPVYRTDDDAQLASLYTTITFDKKEVTFYNSYYRDTSKLSYTRDGKMIKIESMPGTSHTYEIKELTSEKLILHGIRKSSYGTITDDITYRAD
ncbi:lipocalin family protein [Hymenobacter sp. BT730]|uniref:lipocalin family protein n=1 Tax=Hymenobacter sp. BT730 TaxID=3063332 RepID=UPI0026DF565C|nr:lipocalin family protein [Hymenobacter sp. BT730]